LELAALAAVAGYLDWIELADMRFMHQLSNVDSCMYSRQWQADCQNAAMLPCSHRILFQSGCPAWQWLGPAARYMCGEQ